MGKIATPEAKIKMSLAKKGKPGTSLGLKRTARTKELQSKLKKEYYANHQTIWVHKMDNDKLIRTRIDIGLFETYKKDGWIRGRNSSI